MTKVAVACGLDLLHLGHLDHLEKAARLGDELVIIVANDEAYWRKNFCLVPWVFRVAMAERLGRWLGGYLGIKVTAFPSIDEDGSCAETLRLIRPDIFAKGGDRVANTMPVQEIVACREIGCEVRYGIGDVLGSRSEYFKKAIERWGT